MRERVEELERINGRLTVRLEELEDQIFLLHDRVESHRLALQRRGFMQGGGSFAARVQQPYPSPETQYNASPDHQPHRRSTVPYAVQPKARRPVKRIPLSRQQAGQPVADSAEPSAPAIRTGQGTGPQEEIVISEEQFKEFSGDSRSAMPSKTRSGNSTAGRTPQPNVTDERLATTGNSKQHSGSKPKSELSYYREGLALYRSGEYASALARFEDFLNQGPQSDYLDNALYWIGECEFGLGRYRDAIASFDRVLREQPDGNKVPDAMLKMAMAYEKIGDRDQSAKLLELVSSRYPATNAARLAEKRRGEQP